MNVHEHVILVDEEDREMGTAEKMTAHQTGQLHRAFSVFVLRKNGLADEVLLQKRQFDKYHSAGLWSNSCCGHPRPNETIEKAARRRLKEEMGLDTGLEKIGLVHYLAPVGFDLLEHEIDHVFIGNYQEEPIAVNEREVSEWVWKTREAIENDLDVNKENYTPWFSLVFGVLLQQLKP